MLQFRQRADRARCQDNARQKVVRELGRELLVRELVRVGTGLDQGAGLFPDRIVARQKEDAELGTETVSSSSVSNGTTPS